MWTKLVEMMQDPSYKRLGLALIASAMLHALLFGGFNFALPSLKKDMHVIEARIQMPRAVVKQVEVSKPAETVAPKQVLEPKPEALAEPEPMTEPLLPLAEVALETPTAPSPDSPVIAQSSEPAPPQEEQQPVDMGLVINENAYQYVETEFDADIQNDGINYKAKANISYSLIDEKRYQLRWLAKGIGLAALAPDLLQTSEGELTKIGLQPSRYLYQVGNKADKTRTANFDWVTKKVILQTSKGSNTEDLLEGTQDLLSFMYQFMYAAPLQKMEIHIVTGKKLLTYDYTFEGEENINTVFGELKTIHIRHTGNDNDEKTELWLAIDYQYVPVKIRKVEKNGKLVEMIATRINTNRPTVNN